MMLVSWFVEGLEGETMGARELKMRGRGSYHGGRGTTPPLGHHHSVLPNALLEVRHRSEV